MRIDSVPKPVTLTLFLVVSVLKPLILLAAAVSLPEYYGVYARDRGRLVRMEKREDKVNKFDFNPDVTFVIYDKAISTHFSSFDQKDIVIKRLFYIRERFSYGDGKIIRREPVNAWVEAENPAWSLPILVKPVAGQTEAIEVVPKEHFSPGVYSFQIRGAGAQITFSVRHTDIQMNNLCFDEHIIKLWQREYRRCSENSIQRQQGGSRAAPQSVPTHPREDTQLASLIQEGWSHYQAKNWEAAEKAYREVLAQDPENYEANGQLGSIYLKLGDYGKSIFHTREAMNLRPDDPNPYYNMACVYARTGEPDRAITFLRQAVAKGFKDFAWMKRDPDLESIRNDPRFKALTSGR